MRGYTVKTPERVALAMDLRKEGLSWNQLAAHFGVGRNTVRAWVLDPENTAMRARKDSYAQPCMDCGAPTSGSEGRREEPLCRSCAAVRANDERKIWTRGAIILAIQEWAVEYGEPPSGTDWNPYQAGVVLGDPERAARHRQADGQWPWFNTVVKEFGSWNAGIRAAGFEPRAPHGGGGNQQRRRYMRARAGS